MTDWLEEIRRLLEQIRGERDVLRAANESLLQQATQWRQEARTQASIVRECYAAVTGNTGEPGDWNGANPVREKLEALTAERDALRARVAELEERSASLIEAGVRLANAADDVGVEYFDTDTMDDVVAEMQEATKSFRRARPALNAEGQGDG